MATTMVKGDPQGSHELEGKVYKYVPCPACKTPVFVDIAYPGETCLCNYCEKREGMPAKWIEAIIEGGTTGPSLVTHAFLCPKDRIGPSI